jgi:cob(I)alamin adenosyltransferase
VKERWRMPRITRIYTRAGDGGTTRLGGGQEVSKDSRRIDAYGTVDELNTAIGAALAAGLDVSLASELRRIQNELFHLGADLAVREEDKPRVPGPRIEPRHVEALERLLDAMTSELGPLENFILPGGSPGAAALHVARTICRRAERLVVALSHDEAIGPSTLAYLNRLSDALFAMARIENLRKGVPEPLWDSKT